MNDPAFHPDQSPEIDPGLAAIDARLRRCARLDADQARPGMEDRITLATMPGLAERRTIEPSADPEFEVGIDHAPIRFPGTGRTAWMVPVRLAAVVALAVGGVLVYLAARPSPTSSPEGPRLELASQAVEQDVHSWLSLLDSSPHDEILQLASETERLDRSIGDEPAFGAWFLEGESL